MQLVLCNNRIVAHGENFLAMGGVVINTETGAKYENATVAECDGCPSDIDKVGYEYHGGIFKPCAPYGTGNNNGYFMEVCEGCATPRSSGIPIKGGISRENLSTGVIKDLDTALTRTAFTVLWETANVWGANEFDAGTVTLASTDYDLLIVTTKDGGACIIENGKIGRFDVHSYNFSGALTKVYHSDSGYKHSYIYSRDVTDNQGNGTVTFGEAKSLMIDADGSPATDNSLLIPIRIYGVKL